MSAMPKQRRDWMPRCQGRVESESRKMWSKYDATHQLREMPTTGQDFLKCFQSTHKNYEWGLQVTFLYIFSSCTYF